jgi:hypothetical protein
MRCRAPRLPLIRCGLVDVPTDVKRLRFRARREAELAAIVLLGLGIGGLGIRLSSEGSGRDLLTYCVSALMFGAGLYLLAVRRHHRRAVEDGLRACPSVESLLTAVGRNGVLLTAAAISVLALSSSSAALAGLSLGAGVLAGYEAYWCARLERSLEASVYRVGKGYGVNKNRKMHRD